MPCSFMHFWKASIASSGSSEAAGAAEPPGAPEGLARLTTPPSFDAAPPQAATPMAIARTSAAAGAPVAAGDGKLQVHRWCSVADRW